MVQPMPSTKTAPYGSWKSPITSELIVEQTTVLSEVRLVGNDIYWLEGRPREQGRNVIVRASRDSAAIEITPATFNARTRVHEYGGASWLVAGETCIFSNFVDQRLYLQRAGQSVPEPLTPAPLDPKHHFRYGDGVLDEGRRRWIGVREDHTGEGEPVNTIVAIDLDQAGASPGRVLVGGNDFFCSARLSPDGNRMVWLAWDHPNMPWNGTTLHLADIDADGVPAAARAIAGGDGVGVPTGMVARRHRNHLRVRSHRVVEPLRLRNRLEHDTTALPDASRVWRTTMEPGHVDVRVRRLPADRMRVYEGRPRAIGPVGFDEQISGGDRYWIYAIWIGVRR
jgi:hypothetical protein